MLRKLASFLVRKHLTTILLCTILHTLQCSAGEKATPPEERELETLQQTIQDVYRDDFRLARTPEQKVSLAARFREQSRQSQDLPNRYALLQTANRIYQEAGNYHLAIETVLDIEKDFQVNSLAMRVAILSDAASARDIDSFGRCRLTRDFEQAINDALKNEDFELALNLAEFSEKSARRVRNRELTEHVEACTKSVAEIKKSFELLPQYRDTLQTNPLDSVANLELGKYLCFVGDDRMSGLAMLTKSGVAEFEALLELEGSSKQNPLKAGDGWWAASERLEGILRQNARAYAAECYEAALATASELDRARVDQRLLEYGSDLRILGRWVEPVPSSAILVEDRHNGSAGASHENNIYLLRLRSPQPVDGLRVRVVGQMTNLKSGTTRGKVSVSFDGQEWVILESWDTESCRRAAAFADRHDLILRSSKLLTVDRLAVKFEFTGGLDRFVTKSVAIVRE